MVRMFKKARKFVSNSDQSEEDTHRNKSIKHAGRVHDKQLTDKMAQSEKPNEGHRHSTRPLEDEDSSEDEVLVKHRASRKSHRGASDRETLPSRSASGHDLYVHYVPIVTSSPSPPLSNPGSSSSSPDFLAAHQKAAKRAMKKSKSKLFSTENLDKELKDLRVSLMARHDREHDHDHKKSKRSSKHEKRAKHGKKKDPFLSPLAKRWVCYECGKVRSDKIQDRHPLVDGHKMQPNWCGQCRVACEMKGIHLKWNGQRHYCWGCGIVRSEQYHKQNPIADNEMPDPSYCKPCREASPSFQGNLRATSEFGSEISVRDKAFKRQMRDAELSDVEEDDEENTNTDKTKKSTKLNISRDCSLKTKTDSDESEGRTMVEKLKNMYLDEKKKLNSKQGGARLVPDSSGSYHHDPYRPPSCESGMTDSMVSPKIGGFPDNVKDTIQEVDHPTTGVAASTPGQCGHSTKPDQDKRAGISKSLNTACQTDNSENITTSQQPNTSSMRKVHWPADSQMPKPRDEYDSGFSSDASMRSTSSRGRIFRDPAEESTGSPPERTERNDSTGPVLGQSTPNLGGLPKMADSHNVDSHVQHPWVKKNVVGGDQTGQGLAHSNSFPAVPFGYPMPPTPPNRYEPQPSWSSGDVKDAQNYNGSYPWSQHARAPAKNVPNFSKPMSPNAGYRPGASQHSNKCSSGYGTSYGTRPEYLHQDPSNFDRSRYSNGTPYGFASAYPGNGSPDGDDSPESMDHMRSSCAAPDDGFSSPFNFSTFGKSDNNKGANTRTMDDFYSHQPNDEEVRQRTRTFVRSQHSNPKFQWQMYDDGDANEQYQQHQEAQAQAATACGYESSGAGTDGSAKSGIVRPSVTILSIEEITDEEELAELEKDGRHGTAKSTKPNGKVSGVGKTASHQTSQPKSGAPWTTQNATTQTGRVWDVPQAIPHPGRAY